MAALVYVTRHIHPTQHNMAHLPTAGVSVVEIVIQVALQADNQGTPVEELHKNMQLWILLHNDPRWWRQFGYYVSSPYRLGYFCHKFWASRLSPFQLEQASEEVRERHTLPC
jgi:hypothetical protein